jgi:hypothetical protein
MKLPQLQHTWQKILAAVGIMLLLVVTVVAFFVNQYWSPILARQIRSTVLASTDSLYKANFSDADFHIVQGKLVIYNLTLQPDRAIYQKRLQQGTAPNNLYTLRVKRIVFRKMHPLKLYFSRKLDISQIVLSEPELRVHYQYNRHRDASSRSNKTAWQRIKGTLRSLQIREVLLNDVKLMYNDYSGNRLDISRLKEMNLTGKDLLIDSVTQFDEKRFYYFKDIQLELNNFSSRSGNGLYTYRVKQLQYSALSQQLKAYQVALLPAPDSVFAQRKIRTWFMFDADTVEASRFDFKKYNKYRFAQASNVLLSRGNFNVYSNPKGKSRRGNRVVTFPQVAIQKLKAHLQLDTITLKRIHFTYNGYGKRSHKKGSLSFNNTEGRIYNITNDSLALTRNNHTRLQLRTYLMDAGPLDVNFDFNLTDSARSFAYRGRIGAMDMEKLNKATMPFGLVKIASGHLDQLHFDFKANQYEANGKVGFLYHDLRVRILKADTIADRYKRRTIASLMANALVVKHNNPDKPGAAPRLVDVKYVRQPDTPFFKTIWKSLSIGIKSSAGYDPVTEKKVKQQIAQHRADKQRRQAKREMRRRRKQR